MQQKEALEIMKMGSNVFLTGEAGTGKTYVLNAYIKFLKSHHVPLGITASTGIAATHLDGVTIDSWSGLGIRDEMSEKDLRELSHKHHLVRRLQSTKVLIIDEISMILGRRFGSYDQILRFIHKNQLPFGGVQVILCGDLFQLPPVSRDKHGEVDYIFKSKAWRDLKLAVCYLDKPWRQRDEKFLKLLSDIRHQQVSQTTRMILAESQTHHDLKLPHTKLYTHNVDVDAINQKELAKINGEAHSFYMTAVGPEKVTTAMKRSCLAPETLELKKGAAVMFVRNNFPEGFSNGSLGTVVGFSHGESPIVQIFSGKRITVDEVEWTISEGDKIIAQIRQLPLRLAWAITVHKSQGMTLDGAEIDLSKSFVPGMGYVALSRVKSLKHLHLLGYNELALKVSPEISKVDTILHQVSKENVEKLSKINFLTIWHKKREFLYQLTS